MAGKKTTYNADGFIEIPAMAFKQCFDRAAKMLSLQIPGKGKATYTKHFLAGIMVPANLTLRVKKDEVAGATFNCNADGVRGSGKRVRRTFPIIPKWVGQIEVIVVDETITANVFEQHAREAGMLVGIGQYRPENGGSNGRFRCHDFNWSNFD